MEQILLCALRELEQGKPVTLVSIAAAQGSAPRTAGAAMAVSGGQLLTGTVGGGELEYQCLQMADRPERPLMDFSLDSRKAAELGMVCGGAVRVLFTPLTDTSILRLALALLQQTEPGALLLPLDGSAPVLRAGKGIPAHPHLTNHEGKDCLFLPLAKPGRIYLFGGGHVSRELSRLLDVLEYPYLVLDDREEFSCPARFPHARGTFTADYAQLDSLLTGHLAPTPWDCLCVMTRGHLADTEVLRFALNSQAGYIGLMGSRKKREKLFAQLTEEGYSDASRRIVTPIGLPIGGQTPAEVAVSIAAQLVQWRNGTDAR